VPQHFLKCCSLVSRIITSMRPITSRHARVCIPFTEKQRMLALTRPHLAAIPPCKRKGPHLFSSAVSTTLWFPPSMEPVTSAYLHLPFCRRRCHYCDFAISLVGDDVESDVALQGMRRFPHSRNSPHAEYWGFRPGTPAHSFLRWRYPFIIASRATRPRDRRFKREIRHRY
jgi:hypothetical protein